MPTKSNFDFLKNSDIQGYADIAAEIKKDTFTYKKYEENYLLREAVREEAKVKNLQRELDIINDMQIYWSGNKTYEKGFLYVCPECKYLLPLVDKEPDSKVAAEKIREWLTNPDNIVIGKRGTPLTPTKVMALDTKKIPKGGMWFGSTITGIDIRPGVGTVGTPDEEGYEPDPDKMKPLRLDDEAVHALLAGVTGSGKSVCLNTIIASLMMEYAPWEINISLADFKLVEMSRYGELSNPAPHVSKIAATESMEYVISVIYDMYAEMVIRQKFFAKIGVQNIKDFRKKYQVVLPQNILIVDEFQQMYEYANSRQVDVINNLIKQIAKLGRATGYHLFFASQSMKGTMPQDVMNNFVLRICLKATKDISSDVLGNPASADKIHGKGFCYANAGGGSPDFNIRFRVPFLSAEESGSGKTDLQEILIKCYEAAEDIGYRRPLNFFQEGVQRDLLGEATDFNNRPLAYDISCIQRTKQTLIKSDSEIEDVLLLGDSFTFVEPKGKKQNVTLEWMPLRIGDGKNIACIGDSPKHKAYLTSLLAQQFAFKDNTKHFIIEADANITNYINLTETLKDTGPNKDVVIIGQKDFMSSLTSTLNTRYTLNSLMEFMKTSLIQNTLSRLKLSEQIFNKISELPQYTPERPDYNDVYSGKKIKTEEYLKLFKPYIIKQNLEKKDSENPEERALWEEEEDVRNRILSQTYFDESNMSNADVEWIEEKVYAVLATLSGELDQDFNKENMKDHPSYKEVYNQHLTERLKKKNERYTSAYNYINNLYNALQTLYLSGCVNGDVTTFSFNNMKKMVYWVVGFDRVTAIKDGTRELNNLPKFMTDATNMGVRLIFIGSDTKLLSSVKKKFTYAFIISSVDKSYDTFEMVKPKLIPENSMRVKAIGETFISSQYYPLEKDERMVKQYYVEYDDATGVDLFSDFEY